MVVVRTQCFGCIHYREAAGTPERPHTCDAFPEEIPRVIFTNEFIHTKPFLGDHGIQYEIIPELETVKEE